MLSIKHTALAVEDLGGTAEAFESHLDAVCEHYGWARDALSRVIWITDWFEQNPPASPNVVASWAKLLRNVPDCDIRNAAIGSYAKSLKDLPAAFREPFADLARSFRRSEVESEVQPETNQGSGIRDFRNRDQGSRRASRGGSERERINAPSSQTPRARQLVKIAIETNKFHSIHHPEFIEAFKNQCRKDYPDLTIAEAQAAIAAAKQELAP